MSAHERAGRLDAALLKAENELAAARAEVEKITRELEQLREFQHTQANAANDKILALERENLRLKRLLSPVEEG